MTILPSQHFHCTVFAHLAASKGCLVGTSMSEPPLSVDLCVRSSVHGLIIPQLVGPIMLKHL